MSRHHLLEDAERKARALTAIHSAIQHLQLAEVAELAAKGRLEEARAHRMVAEEDLRRAESAVEEGEQC